MDVLDTLLDNTIVESKSLHLQPSKKVMNERKLNEGEFSWLVGGEPIYSTEGHQRTVYMKDNKGNVFKEDSYEGYGEFGGKDFYELLAEMNADKFPCPEGKELRQHGIDIAFGQLEGQTYNAQGDSTEGVLYPRFSWEEDASYDSLENPEGDPNQGWYEEDEEEEEDWNDEDDWDDEDMDESKNPYPRAVKLFEDDAERDVPTRFIRNIWIKLRDKKDTQELSPKEEQIFSKAEKELERREVDALEPVLSESQQHLQNLLGVTIQEKPISEAEENAIIGAIGDLAAQGPLYPKSDLAASFQHVVKNALAKQGFELNNITAGKEGRDFFATKGDRDYSVCMARASFSANDVVQKFIDQVVDPAPEEDSEQKPVDEAVEEKDVVKGFRYASVVGITYEVVKVQDGKVTVRILATPENKEAVVKEFGEQDADKLMQDESTLSMEEFRKGFVPPEGQSVVLPKASVDEAQEPSVNVNIGIDKKREDFQDIVSQVKDAIGKAQGEYTTRDGEDTLSIDANFPGKEAGYTFKDAWKGKVDFIETEAFNVDEDIKESTVNEMKPNAEELASTAHQISQADDEKAELEERTERVVLGSADLEYFYLCIVREQALAEAESLEEEGMSKEDRLDQIPIEDLYVLDAEEHEVFRATEQDMDPSDVISFMDAAVKETQVEMVPYSTYKRFVEAELQKEEAEDMGQDIEPLQDEEDPDDIKSGQEEIQEEPGEEFPEEEIQ